MKHLIYIFIFLLFSQQINAASVVKFIGSLYTIDSDTITVSWSPGQNVEYYEAQLILIDKDINYPIKTTTSNSCVFQRPRSGHFKIRVRSCNSQYKSPWVETTELQNAKVDGENMAWIIYWKLPAPVIIIE